MFFDRPGIKTILQAESAECGLACIAMICSFHGRQETLTEIRRRFPVSLKGSNIKDLIQIADIIGFTSRAVRCELDELEKLEMPAVLHWDLDHYVVLREVGSGYAIIFDPAKGRRKLPLDEVSKHFTGVALELTPAPAFEKKAKVERVALSDLWTRLSGFKPVIVQLIVLTLLLQVFGLAMPIANQMVIDDVIGRGDTDLLTSVLIGFGLFAIIQAAIDLLRSFIQLHAGQRLSVQLTGNLLRHMLRLPVDFFERRQVGDILGRYGSLEPIQHFLTGGIVGVVLDVLMIVPVGIVMFVYSPLLSGLVVANLALVFVVRAATFDRNRRFTDEAIGLSSKTQSIFLETLRAARAIKLSGRERERHSIWQNAMTDQLNLSFRQATFNLWGTSGFTLVMAAQGLLMLYFGATEIMKGAMSLGMFLAFQSYASQFSDRTKSLVGQFFSFRMLALHLERLADIVHTDQEAGLDSVSVQTRPMSGLVELRNLDFRYSPQDAWVFQGVSFRACAGEKVTIVGPSGGGKSTLLKILTGLYRPIDGDIYVDGHPLKTLGLRGFREQIGVVMQDDQLLSGTIADNIAFFDAQIDMEQVETVCHLAHIHDDIVKLPMGYHSLIGDMGSVLSGGQKQRVLLARALYRKPKILFMDEGTANLDSALEDAILNGLRPLGITQIMVAHRQAAIDFADKLYFVGNGTVAEVAPQKTVVAAIA